MLVTKWISYGFLILEENSGQGLSSDCCSVMSGKKIKQSKRRYQGYRGLIRVKEKVNGNWKIFLCHLCPDTLLISFKMSNLPRTKMLSWPRFQDVLQTEIAANEKSGQWTAPAKAIFDKAGELLLEVFSFPSFFLLLLLHFFFS